jgi:hypothetical protein
MNEPEPMTVFMSRSAAERKHWAAKERYELLTQLELLATSEAHVDLVQYE